MHSGRTRRMSTFSPSLSLETVAPQAPAGLPPRPLLSLPPPGTWGSRAAADCCQTLNTN